MKGMIGLDDTLWQNAIKVAFIGEGMVNGRSVSDARNIALLISDVLEKGADIRHPAVQAMIARLAQLASVVPGLSENLMHQMAEQYVRLESAIGPDFVGTVPSVTG
jgi:hypothetical protein